MDSTNMRRHILLQGISAMKTLEENKEKVFNFAIAAEFDRIIMSGAGDKYAVPLIAQYLWRKYGREPLAVIHSRDMADNPPYMDENTLVIFLSQSGKTKDTIDAALQALKRRAQIVVITNLREREKDSLYFVEEHGGTVFTTRTEIYPERALPSTMTFHSSLSLLYYLLAELAGKDLYEKIYRAAERVHELSNSREVEERAKKTAEELSKFNARYVFGDGPRYGLARKTALVMTMEGVKKNAFALESEEFLHSAIETLEEENEEKLPLVLLLPPPGEPFRRSAKKIAKLWREYAPVFEIEAERGIFSPQIQAVMPIWMAYHEALLCNVDPGVSRLVKKVRSEGF